MFHKIFSFRLIIAGKVSNTSYKSKYQHDNIIRGDTARWKFACMDEQNSGEWEFGKVRGRYCMKKYLGQHSPFLKYFFIQWRPNRSDLEMDISFYLSVPYVTLHIMHFVRNIRYLTEISETTGWWQRGRTARRPSVSG